MWGDTVAILSGWEIWVTYGAILLVIYTLYCGGACGYAVDEEEERKIKLFEEIRKGWLVYNPNHMMKVGVENRIEARISKSYEDNIMHYLKGTNEVEIDSIDVNDFMKVTMTGDNFSINSLSEADQVVPPKDFAQWEWNVKPEKSGQQPLYLHVAIKLTEGGREAYRNMPSIENWINVQADKLYETKRFLIKEWRWVIALIVAPILAAYMKVVITI